MTTNTPTHPDILARISRIVIAVAEEAQVTTGEIIMKERGSFRASRARNVAMAAAREATQLPYAEIGQHFGGRDHSTVMAACALVTDLRAGNAEREEHWQHLISL